MAGTYKVKEIYYTIQGEGAQTGRPAVFVRFSGCNLWSGREEDRHDAICKFCDTDFRGTDGVRGGTYNAQDLATEIRTCWPDAGSVFAVFTGGEPMLQMDVTLIDALRAENIEIAVETNGTITVPQGIDWICVSPKAGTEIVQRTGNELKIVYPQTGLDPMDYQDWDFHVFSIQPMDGPLLDENIRLAIRFCMQHPQWKLSLQSHKLIGIP